MKKNIRFFITVFVAVMLVISICLYAGAASLLQEVQAYLNFGVTISLDGQPQIMYDANGKQVFPITYSGTTYVPVRAVSNMLGIDVGWDANTQTVLLGASSAQSSEKQDKVETVSTNLVDLTYFDKTKNTDGFKFKKIDHATDNLGNEHMNPLRIMHSCEENYWETYLLDGKYDTFSGTLFIDYDDRDSATYCYIRVYGDGELLYDSPKMTSGVRPVDFEIDVSGVDEFTIEINGTWSKSYSWLAVYIGEGVLEG